MGFVTFSLYLGDARLPLWVKSLNVNCKDADFLPSPRLEIQTAIGEGVFGIREPNFYEHKDILKITVKNSKCTGF